MDVGGILKGGGVWRTDSMTERVAVFNLTEVSGDQRMTHAHIRGDLIHFHVHDPEKEPKSPEALVVSKWDLWRVMDINYWKKEASLNLDPSDETNAEAADVGLRAATFRWKKGKQTKEDEVSFFSLRQVDARLRFRVRDVRKASREDLAGLPPGFEEPEEEEEEGEGEEEEAAENGDTGGEDGSDET